MDEIYQPHHKARDIWNFFTIISKEYVIFHMIIILNDKKFDDKDCCIERIDAFCDAHFGYVSHMSSLFTMMNFSTC